MEYVQVAFVLVATLVSLSIESRIVLQKLENQNKISNSTENCIAITACKIVHGFIKENDSSDAQTKNLLKKYACGFDDNGIAKVSCPKELPEEFEQLRGVIDDSTHPNYKLLPTKCGVSDPGDKITYGDDAQLFEFPWAAALKFNIEKNPYRCGGSLINDRYVLTAAHCVQHPKIKVISVRLGEHNFNTNPDCKSDGEEQDCAESYQDFEVDLNDTIIHSDYNEKQEHNDIALIRLRRPANITVYSVSPICLPITAGAKANAVSKYTVIGWGNTEQGRPSPILQKVKIAIVETGKCAPIYGRRKRQIINTQICAGVINRQDSCKGDSGGPLSAEYSFGGKLRVVQYGIVSYGPTACGTDGFPGVYTRVDRFTKWILDNLKP